MFLESPTPTPPAAPVKALAEPRTIWSEGKLDLSALEQKLRLCSYVAGYEPTAEDNRVFAALDQASTSNYPQITRWLRNITTFTDAERASWR